jgi:hypothetical protein
MGWLSVRLGRVGIVFGIIAATDAGEGEDETGQAEGDQNSSQVNCPPWSSGNGVRLCISIFDRSFRLKPMDSPADQTVSHVLTQIQAAWCSAVMLLDASVNS